MVQEKNTNSNNNRSNTNWVRKVVKVRRITKVVKGGKKLRFGALVIIGNEKGLVGVGVGKADDVVEAVKKAANDGRRNLVMVPLTKTFSIPHVSTGQYGASNVLLKPASEGSGVSAGGSVRILLEAAGVQNIMAKQLGSGNLLNNARATVEGLSSLRSYTL